MYLIPWIVYLVSLFVGYYVSRASAKIKEYKTSEVVPFSMVIVIIIVAVAIAKGTNALSFGNLSSLDSFGESVSLVVAESVIAFILGILSAVNFHKNLLVKEFKIDLSPLYRGVNR